MPRRFSLLVGWTTVLAITVALLTAILHLNSGRFVYTLDDAYIHLALAKRIAAGHYGINPGEYSAPSSSVLWPFLLAPFQRLPFTPKVGDWVGVMAPLGLNLLAALLSVPVLASLAHKLAARHSMARHRVAGHRVAGHPEAPHRVVLAIVMILLVMGCNLVGLVFTGMEHSWQLLATLMVLDGALALADGHAPRTDFYLAIVIGPLLRYENLALSAAAILFLCLRGKIKTAFFLLAALITPLAAFSIFLKSMDLAWLPTSIFAKSGLVASHGGLLKAFGGIYRNLQSPTGTLEALAMIALVAVAWLTRAPMRERQWAACAALAAGLHLVAGRFGWFNRYEVSSYVFALLSLGYLLRKSLADQLLARGSARLAICVILSVLLLLHNYFTDLLLVPLASNNIYEQQFQMRRFALEFYPKPTAVMDLGCVAFGNPNYVLDLSGLASYEALRHLQNGDAPVWMDRMAQRQSVTWAMVYEHLGAPVPAHWKRIGRLILGKRRITPAASEVAFFAITDQAYREITGLLPAFRESLPPGVEFQVEPHPEAEWRDVLPSTALMPPSDSRRSPN